MFEDAGENAIAQVESQEPPVAETPQETPKEDPKPEPAKPEDKRPTGYDRVKAKLAAREAELAEAKAKLAEAESKHKEQVKGKPDPKDYEGKSWDEYYADLAEWKASQAIEQRLSKKEAEEKERSLREEAQKRQKNYEVSAQKLAKEIPDFVDVTENYDGPWNPMIAQALIDSDMGPQVAYFLAKNPEEAEKLDGMNYGQISRFFGRIESRLESKSPEVKTTQAPPPIKPVGGTSKGSYDPYGDKSESNEAYMKWREANS